MKIRVVSTCFNERPMMPFYLRHYSAFADDILVYDDNSKDGSRELVSACPAAKLCDWPFGTGLDDNAMLKLWKEAMKDAVNDGVDWLIMPDIDELVWASDMRKTLSHQSEYDIVPALGFDMTGDFPNPDDGRQIWEQNQLGVPSSVYSKAIVVRPSAKLKYRPGRHKIEDYDPTRVAPDVLKLFHYRFLSPAYTHAKNLQNHSRVAMARQVEFDGTVLRQGYGSDEYALEIQGKATNVVR